MKRKVTLLNAELSEFFLEKFPLKKDNFKNFQEIVNFYLEIENKMTIEIMNILYKIDNVPYKTKSLSQYLLEEKLTVSFDQTYLGKKINK